MDSSRKGFSSSRRISNPSFSGESNENEFIPNEMDPDCKSPNPKKPHFMSPTECTKSKVVVKRVLGERIESLASCDSSNAPPKPRIGGRFSACSYSSKSDDEDVLSTFSCDASMKPYDPRTNYDSPRPKYLRYKPNRPHGILSVSLNSQNQEFIEGEKGSESDQEPQECASESSGVEAEKGDDHAMEYTDSEEEEEEEDEELEEEKGGSLKWIVKLMLLLAAVTLSTSFLSTMNDPTPSPVVEAVGVLRDGFNHMHRYLSEAVFPNVDKNTVWVNGSSELHTSNVQTGFLERNSGIVHIEPSEEGELEDGSDFSDLEFAEEKEADVNEEIDQFPELEITESDVANDQESVAMDAVVQILSGIIDDCSISDGNQLENSDRDEASLGDEKLQEKTMIEPVEAADIITMETSDRDEASLGEEKPQEKAMIELVEAGDIVAMESDEQVETDTLTVESETRLRDEEVKVDSELQTTDEGFNPVEVLKSMRLANWLYILLTTIMASLACIFYFLRAKQVHAPDSLHQLSERKEELISERPLVEFQHKPEKSVFIEETAKEQRAKTQAAPIVELLAELDLDIQELSSFDQQGRVKTEESAPVHVESRTPPVGQVPSVNASNSGDFSSYGSLTAEKSVLRKQARREKVEKVVPTPVRRSSRIRNLSITSP